jgi:hypothetical protein
MGSWAEKRLGPANREVSTAANYGVVMSRVEVMVGLRRAAPPGTLAAACHSASATLWLRMQGIELGPT